MKNIFRTSFIAATLLGLSIGLSSVMATGQERARISPTPTATPTPTTTPLPIASPTPQRQTIETLQAAIRQRVYGADVRRGRVGVKVVSLNTGKVIFENDADKYFMPASNMKNFTVAAALERLGPEFRFVTSVYSAVPIDPSGTLKGDLRIYGRGDISISTAFFGTTPTDPETYYKGIDRLVDGIIAAGVKRVEGAIIGDDSYFRGFAIPGSWEWDDLQSYYGAEVSALPVNDNAVDVFVRPGNIGGACFVTISPANSLMRFNNLCVTTAASAKSELRVTKQLDRNILDIRGTLPAGASGYSGSISITRPGELFVALLKQRLEARGVTIAGQARMQNGSIASMPAQIEIAKLESVPFSQIAANTMKPSQNMYTETILWTLGERARARGTGIAGPEADSSVLGTGEVKTFLTSIGVPADGISQYDGSGLSRHNLITPSAVITLYTYMAKQSKHAQAWRDSLTIGGVDGTLRNRFKGTTAAANFRGKTGTIDQVSALSGYVTTAAGEHLVVSILVNGVSLQRTRTALIDDIVVQLADYNGRID